MYEELRKAYDLTADRVWLLSLIHIYDDRTRRSIGNNFITALYEDAKGNIWVGTDVGLYIYYLFHHNSY